VSKKQEAKVIFTTIIAGQTAQASTKFAEKHSVALTIIGLLHLLQTI